MVVGVNSSIVHSSSRGQVSRGAGPVKLMYLCKINYAFYKCYKLITKAVNRFNVVSTLLGVSDLVCFGL